MKRFTLSVALLAFLLPALAGAADFPRDEYQGYLLVQNQGWKSNDWNTGSARVDDSGISVGAGFQAQLESADWSGFWRTRLQAYKGFSKYKETTPFGEISADTDLSGMSAEIDYLHRLPVGESFAFEPVLGMALRMDRRTIGGGTVGNEGDNTFFRRGRYREERRGFVARIGLRMVFRELGGPGDVRQLDDGSTRNLFLEGGFLVPVYLQSQGGLPRERIPSRYYPAYYLEAGARIGRWLPALYYEAFRFEGPGGSGAGTRAQSDVVGARIGMAF